jgi:hypothetical protein
VRLRSGVQWFETSLCKQFLRAPLISKITTAKWTGGVVQAVEYLLYKHEALSPNSNPTKIIIIMIIKLKL